MTIKCILGLIDKMKSQKLPRPYGNHSRALEENKYAIMELLIVCNPSLKSVSLQEGWKMVNVTAIPEKVPRSEELQTVTLKSVLSK